MVKRIQHLAAEDSHRVYIVGVASGFQQLSAAAGGMVANMKVGWGSACLASTLDVSFCEDEMPWVNK